MDATFVVTVTSLSLSLGLLWLCHRNLEHGSAKRDSAIFQQCVPRCVAFLCKRSGNAVSL